MGIKEGGESEGEESRKAKGERRRRDGKWKLCTDRIFQKSAPMHCMIINVLV